jgi:anti-sigma B factor antagonist
VASPLIPDRSFELRAPGLTVSAELGPDGSTLTLTGELDFGSRMTFELAVRRLLRDGPPRVRVELGGLRFLAVAGAHAFEDADRRCREAGGGLVLAGPSRATLRLLALFGLTALVAGA